LIIRKVVNIHMSAPRSLLNCVAAGIFSLASLGAAAQSIDLPEGFVSQIAAAPPLVNHPIMATLGSRGQLFVGDAAGTNLNKAGLEKQLPNRVLLLTDTDGDDVYDRVSVFADHMTFPQGGVWLDGSLYVASPPGIWKLTDTNSDGVADQREMIAGGFEYTGNAADVHGPFLHPNGRLYWCHGRKGHDVRQKDGTLVHAGLASGIWSCQPDGSDVRWHSLSCADNPTEIDFTPEGEVVAQ
jgi:glucose/arabinose dehydrogenase